MTGEEVLLQRAQESLHAAKILLAENLPNIAASRAYYAMFYMAEMLLQKKRGLSFSSHAAVVAAFGKEFSRSGEIDPKFHRYLIASQNARQIGDYGGEKNISQQEAEQILAWAEEFFKIVLSYL